MIEDLLNGYRQIAERVVNKYSFPHGLTLYHRAMYKRVSESFDDELNSKSLEWIARKHSLKLCGIDELIMVVNTINAEKRRTFYNRFKKIKRTFPPFNLLNLN